MRDDVVLIRVNRRWLKAIAYLHAAFLVYVATLAFMPEPTNHFSGGWRWIYESGWARWYGILFMSIGLGVFVTFQLGCDRVRDAMLVAMLTAFAIFASKVFRSRESGLTPGPGIYLASVGIVASLMGLVRGIVKPKAAPETGA